MLEFNRILLIAPSEMTRTPAFERAQALACATGALLHIVAFDHVQALAMANLMACVNDFHPDLVIQDAHYVPALDRAFHRPLDWQLLRDCPTHLHWVTSAEQPKPLKILAAIDLSHLEELTQGLNDRILDLASTLATRCGAALHLLNVGGWSQISGSPTSVPTGSLDASLRDAIEDAQQEAFDVLAERYGIQRSRRHSLTGIPHEVIELFARHNNVDMVVLGRVHEHGTGRFIGNTAESVLNRAPCSLMIVKPLASTVKRKPQVESLATKRGCESRA